ncbi:glycoside hydrolase family 172 protein [Pontibacter mangrovi]|uniref:DUF2961 domain-containing protein n=1 Tax=Pontibacter mangrovi TaxID=2589816 RepID=A0A501WES1_9BACT|nr:glycoside hydrolase family 172 protein [Pontibacter mangrovi]TPE44046.1 DUF2961 domain-containing protein [Pontibacter mangrovi]
MRRSLKSIYTLFLVGICALLSQCASVKDSSGASEVTFNSLLQEMADRESLARYPSPAYTLAQFSSYDRAMQKPGDSTWFANWDRSMFLREETTKGRQEYVLFDTTGPGAVVRFWMTFAGEDSGKGTLRFYLDGSEEPVIAAPAMDVLSGNVLTDGPLATSVSDATDYKMRGHNLYLPIPYAKSCKITYESQNIKDAGAKTGGEAVYYNINYRTYQDASVKTFTMADVGADNPVLKTVQEKLSSRYRGTDELKTASHPVSGEIKAGNSLAVSLAEGPHAVRQIKLKLEADNLEQALRSTVLEISFDGERTVWSPVGDFFGTGYQLRSSNTWYTKVDTVTGELSAWWVMPFEKEAKLTVHNLTDAPVTVEGEVLTSPWKWDDRSMHFGASWHQFTNLFTGEMKNNEGGGDPFDINYVQLDGKGTYVGDAITLFNTVYAWWGEGDEKVYVDGENFPSHVGTGTEDYYGYAWCRPERFSNHPFIAQPDGSGNFVPGYTMNMRFRGLDAIPFSNTLKFDMEMWHWTRAHINFAPVSFYYMLPGGKTNIAPDVENAKEPVVLKRSDLISPVVADGKIEGEQMIFENATGGNFRYQNTQKYGWSDNMQVFWHDTNVGDKLKLSFVSDKAGKFHVAAHLTKAPDYGKFKFSLNGKEVKNIVDGYSKEVKTETVNLGRFALQQGQNTLEVEVVQSRPNEKETAFFGLDYLSVDQYPKL